MCTSCSFATSPIGQHADVTETITYAEAAEVLDCVASNVSKLIAEGYLEVHRPPGRIRGQLLRADVERLAELRREAAAQPKSPRRRFEPVDHRPDTDPLWLTPTQAAEQIGVTAQAIRARVKRGRLPAVENGGKVWIGADHFHQAEAAWKTMHTRQPWSCGST